jgi:hypothetical protein
MSDLHHPQEVENLNAVGGHCPRCGAEYRPGFTTCADCGVPLVPGPAPENGPWNRPPEEKRTNDDPDVESVATLPYEEAWLLAGRLRADGIEAHVFPDDLPAPFGRALTPTADVLVHTSRLDEARRVVERYRG